MKLQRQITLSLAAVCTAAILSGCSVLDTPGTPLSAVSHTQRLLAEFNTLKGKVADLSAREKARVDFSHSMSVDRDYTSIQHFFKSETPSDFEPGDELSRSLAQYADQSSRIRVITYYTGSTPYAHDAAVQRSEVVKQYFMDQGLGINKVETTVIKAMGFRRDTMERFRHLAEIRFLPS